MTPKGVKVVGVEPGGLAEAVGIRAGDVLLTLNGEPVLDQLNYQFLVSAGDETTVTFRHPDGSEGSALLENGGDGLGLDLAEDPIRVCRQNCVFCFVKQMPKGFRKSLYLKDEDIRLSFLYGHFTTLSNSDDAELRRIVRERLSPIHVSVHATDPATRVAVVGNPREGDILRKLDILLEGGVAVHTQVVLAPGLNDGPVWERTLRDLWARRAYQDAGPFAGRGGVLSLSCVPVGLTAHREGLPEVRSVDADYARAFQKTWRSEVQRLRALNDDEPWLYLADEWFTRAGMAVPQRSFYARDWAQIENGVGLIRRFQDHARRFQRTPKALGFRGRRLLVLTGASFAPYLGRVAAGLNARVGAETRVVSVPNLAFGESVTVAGLLCGQDLARAALADREAHRGRLDWVDAVVVPSASLRAHPGPSDQYDLGDGSAGEATPFLDDVTLGQIAKVCGVPVVPSGDNLSQLLDNLVARHQA